MHRIIKKGWSEFAVKNVFNLILTDEILKEYLPFDEMKQNRLPNKEFFWGISFTVNSEWAEQ